VNIAKMMQQARKMQQNLERMQQELAEMEVVGESGGGMVRVTMKGDRSVKQIVIDDSLWEEQDKALIEDLVAAAVNHALHKLEELSKEKQQSLMAGMPLPPGFSL